MSWHHGYVLYYRSRQGSLRRCLHMPGWAFPAALALIVVGTLHLAWRFQDLIEHHRLYAQVAEVRAQRNQERHRLLAVQGHLAMLHDTLAPMIKLTTKLAQLTNLEGSGGGPLSMGSPVPSQTAYGGENRLSRQLAAMSMALVEEVAFQENRQRRLAILLGERAQEFAARPSLWPTRGPVNSPFGYRRMVGSHEFHKGMDIGAPVGTQVVAPADGKVVSVGYEHGYGLTVVLEHRNGLTTVYAHLREAEVEEGDSVDRGTPIALSGMSGRTTGAHLHYEVRLNGTPVDPADYLLN